MEEITQEQQQAHEAEMIAKADGVTADTNNEVEGDSLLAGKYKTPEDLEKAYKELESKLGKQEPETEVVEETEVISTEEAKEVAKEASINFDDYATEFANNGEISEDSYAKLEEAGITKDTVDKYIQGQQAMVEKAKGELIGIVGSEEGYNNMITWASENLDESEIASFNDSLEVSEDVARFAIQGLAARYKATQQPNLVQARSAGETSNAGRGYATKTEMMQAIQSKQYKTDASYRELVQHKINYSTF